MVAAGGAEDRAGRHQSASADDQQPQRGGGGGRGRGEPRPGARGRVRPDADRLGPDRVDGPGAVGRCPLRREPQRHPPVDSDGYRRSGPFISSIPD